MNETSLTILEKKSALSVFTNKNEFDPILEKIAKDARSMVCDIKTAKGRAEIASMAHKVARTKTYLDGLGKELVDELKEVPKKIDESRKAMRDFLDALKEEVRKPLDEYEAEVERLAQEALAKAEAEKLAKQIETDHELALFMDAEFNRVRDERAATIKAEQEAAAKLAEQQRIEREARIAEEAEQRAKQEAELKAKQERELAERQILEAKLNAERAEREKLEAADKAERDRKFALEQFERDKQAAIEAERKRAEEAKAAEEAAIAKREANKAHVARINNIALSAIVENTILTNEQAKEVVIAIAKSLIPNIEINY